MPCVNEPVKLISQLEKPLIKPYISISTFIYITVVHNLFWPRATSRLLKFFGVQTVHSQLEQQRDLQKLASLVCTVQSLVNES